MSRGIHRKALSMGLTFALILSMTLVTAVSANSGGITSSATCSAGEVHVFLNNNVSSDRKVTVTSTIPGFTSTGITDKSYNTIGNPGNVEIWSASGPQPFAGTVTLVIKFSNGAVEASYSKTMTAQGPCPAPGFTVDKGVSLSANGPFVAELTTTTGTTVHYRITITNTGNVTLTGVTLSDNTFNLVAKGCTVPTSLAAGAHYDCDYTSTAVTGTTTNIATGDTDQTGPDTGTAKVNAAPAPEPGFTVDKGVSLSADGPFAASLTTTTGTTVYYRITITNTGNVALHGVTLSDNTFDLVAKGCTIPAALAVGVHYDCDYTDVAATGTKVNIATGDTDETGPDTGTATVTAAPAPAPDLRVRKAVGLSADGPFVNVLTVSPGTTVFYRITVTNTGNVPLTGVTLSDDTFNLVDKGCTIPTSLAIGASFDCDYSAVSAETTTVNTATGDSNETGPDSDTATVNPAAQQEVPVLTIEKSNDAPIETVEFSDGNTKDVPTAPEGSTVTFTLSYTHSGPATKDATITDVLPVGLTYVVGSATGSADFSFDGYDSGTRTLTWTAAEGVSASGSVTYKAKVDVGASELNQPLTNVATIVSEDTPPDSAESDVFVPVIPEGETNVPTAPPTDTLEQTDGPSGSSLPLVLSLLGIILLAVGVATPVPARVRRRSRP